jgi:hypothetical protein
LPAAVAPFQDERSRFGGTDVRARCFASRAPPATRGSAKEIAMFETTSAGRVPAHTALDVNLDIKRALRSSIDWYREHPTAIPDRLKKLDREWDIERALAAWSSGLTLVGLALGLRGRRNWFALPAIAQSFYMQHTLQGWCPPLPVMRRMGYRTANEIERERCALKDLLREDNAEKTDGGMRIANAPLEELAVVAEERSAL